MNRTYKQDELAAPEMTAKVWDDYLHRCGVEAYISARVRFFHSRHDTRSMSGSSTGQPQIDHDPFGGIWLRRPELTEGG